MHQAKSGFRFKQFYVNHQRCAMKVGTDGILLGAWADLTPGERLLDLGCGSGLIALMLAQRTSERVHISALELDTDAFLQAQENIQASPWAEKMALYHQDINDFCPKCGQKFDVIVSNPPYFPPAQPCASSQRALARYAQQSHAHWLQLAATCLREQGQIHVILPVDAGETLIKQTALFCWRRCEVITKQGKTPQRLLLTFGLTPKPVQRSQLCIYNAENQYTDEFIQLTKAFYLKF
ncbi:MAG: tRNA1(Val) (adenine(37)-N6)-methyltransferase [[Pasteurella] aerogenes]|nr:tRNA1(Val) (adenine(37)-N6)-methyltransferase [[Pasteurella] aerogenes]